MVTIADLHSHTLLICRVIRREVQRSTQGLDTTRRDIRTTLVNGYPAGVHGVNVSIGSCTTAVIRVTVRQAVDGSTDLLPTLTTLITTYIDGR